MQYKVYHTDTFTNKKSYYIGKRSKWVEDFTWTSFEDAKIVTSKVAYTFTQRSPEYTAVFISL